MYTEAEKDSGESCTTGSKEPDEQKRLRTVRMLIGTVAYPARTEAISSVPSIKTKQTNEKSGQILRISGSGEKGPSWAQWCTMRYTCSLRAQEAQSSGGRGRRTAACPRLARIYCETLT